jgi:hypothetical protein
MAVRVGAAGTLCAKTAPHRQSRAKHSKRGSRKPALKKLPHVESQVDDGDVRDDRVASEGRNLGVSIKVGLGRDVKDKTKMN